MNAAATAGFADELGPEFVGTGERRVGAHAVGLGKHTGQELAWRMQEDLGSAAALLRFQPSWLRFPARAVFAPTNEALNALAADIQSAGERAPSLLLAGSAALAGVPLPAR